MPCSPNQWVSSNCGRPWRSAYKAAEKIRSSRVSLWRRARKTPGKDVYISGEAKYCTTETSSPVDHVASDFKHDRALTLDEIRFGHLSFEIVSTRNISSPAAAVPRGHCTTHG